MNIPKLSGFAGALLFGVLSPAHAAVTVYTSQAAFVAATQLSATASFQHVSDMGSLPSTFSGTAGTFGYEAAALLGTQPDGFLVLPAYSGPAAEWLSVDNSAAQILFRSFTGTVNGAGGSFFPTSFDGSVTPGLIRVVAVFATESVTRTLDSTNPDSFVGFLSDGDGLLSLSVTSDGPVSPLKWPTVGNFVMGSLSPVDDLSSVTSSLLGTLLLAAVLRRNRRRPTY